MSRHKININFYNFSGINIQFIKNAKIFLRSLAVKELFERHTGENLKKVIIDVLNRFDINLIQIYTCTTDNATNMVKLIELCKLDVDFQNDFEDMEHTEELSSSLDNEASIRIQFDLD